MNTRRKLAGRLPLVPEKQTYLRKDGEIITVEVHETLLRDRHGAIVGLRSAALDVSEHIRKEEEIWQTTAELRAIFQALPDLFLRLDTAGCILDYRSPQPPACWGPGKTFRASESRTWFHTRPGGYRKGDRPGAKEQRDGRHRVFPADEGRRNVFRGAADSAALERDHRHHPRHHGADERRTAASTSTPRRCRRRTRNWRRPWRRQGKPRYSKAASSRT